MCYDSGIFFCQVRLYILLTVYTHSNIFRSLQKILVTAACLILGARAAVTWLNSLDGPLHYQCPAHQSIKHVFSVHNNGAEDRQFSLSCADVPVDFSSVTENCYWIASKAIQIQKVLSEEFQH